MKERSLPFENIERDILVKKESDTSPRFGCEPDKRPVDKLLQFGIINIDKPKGPTSHQVSAYVQHILNIDKSGHSGTLDPKVTGVLPVALQKATKITQYLLTAGKEYIAVMHLHADIEEYKIYEACGAFVGKIKQKPPLRSAVKRRDRFRTIYYLDIMEIDGKDVLFKVGCEAGTYIRKLIHDIGQKIGCGAHMSELRRTKAGPFNEGSLVTLQDLTDAFWYWKNKDDEKQIKKAVQPVENAVSHMPKVWIFDTTVDSLCHGALLHIPGISKLNSKIEKDQIVAVMTLKNELVALGRARMSSKDIMKKK